MPPAECLTPLPAGSDSLMSYVLDAMYAVFALVSAPWWARKARGGWAERFGRTPALPPKRRLRILVHAVSVGEVNLTRPLVDRLRRHAEVVVTATTDTGLARARQLYENDGRDARPTDSQHGRDARPTDSQHGQDARPTEEGAGLWVARYPLDATRCVQRFLDAVDPDAVALIELEVWPNFVRACRRRGIPAAVVNGRLSERSFQRYRLIRPIVARLFQQLALVAAQDETYAERFRALGAPSDRVHVTGSMKWDSAATGVEDARVESLAREMGIDRDRPLIVAGSTAPDEHDLLRRATPAGAQLLVAPRRPEWWDAAAEVFPGCVRRSRTARQTLAPLGQPRHNADSFLLDTIGELRQAYALADVAVIGRSFGQLHGSDPMEAAALGKPVVVGPAVDDFREIVRALQETGGLIQTDRNGLAGALNDLLDDESPMRHRSASPQMRAPATRRDGAQRRVDFRFGRGWDKLIGVWLVAREGKEAATMYHLGVVTRYYDTGAQHMAEQASGRARRTARDVQALEARCDRLAMLCEAMWTMMREQLNLTDEQLLDRINQIDLTDGRLDGKVDRAGAIDCYKCGRTVSRRFARCMYCGEAVAQDPFA